MDAPRDPDENELEDQLLEFDEVFAAGKHPSSMIADGLSDECREGISCLKMLEEMRLSGSLSRTPGFLSAELPKPLAESASESNAAQLGRFQILKLLGQGGCGVVFLAQDSALHRRVAIKLPRPEAILTADSRQRFIREGRAAAALDHPNIVTVFEAGEIGAVCFLASAYSPGITLSEWLARNTGPISPRAAAQLIATLANAMDYAHEKGVCHRDLKPSNILLEFSEPPSSVGRESEETASGCGLQSAIPKIIDFGLAKVLQSELSGTGTRSGAVFGTPRYMAPEQAQGQTRAVGPPADIHALGVILYELLTGRPPYHGDTDLQILSNVVAAEPNLPSRVAPQVPRDLETICLKCLEKEPENRYGSMRQLANDLRCFLEMRPIQARHIGWPARTAKWIRRHPREVSAVVAIGVLGLTLLGSLIWIRSRESEHSADMKKASEEIGMQKALVDEMDWLERNQQYAAQIRTGGILKNERQLRSLRSVLLTQIPAPGQKDLRGFEWHYLWHSGRGFMVTEPPSTVTDVTYSDRGDRCAAICEDHTIHLFDRRTGKRLAKLEGHTLDVTTLDFLKDDSQLLSTSFVKTSGPEYRGEYILWSLVGEPKILRRGSYSHCSKVGPPIFSTARAARALFVVDRGHEMPRLLRIDLEDGSEMEIFRDEKLFLAVATPDGNRLAVVSQFEEGSLVEIFEPATTRRFANVFVPRKVHMAAVSADGETLALGLWCGGLSLAVELRELVNLKLRRAVEFSLPVRRLVLDRLADRLAVFTEKNHIHILGMKRDFSFGPYIKHEATALGFSPDGEEIAVGTTSGWVRAGKRILDGIDEFLTGPPLESEAWCAAFSPDGANLAVGYDNENVSVSQTLQLWDLATAKSKSLLGHDATVMAMAYSPDGKTLATASFDSTVRLWDAASGKCLHEMKGHTSAVRALAFSPRGQHVASAGSDLSINIWNVADGTLGKSWLGHNDMVRALAFSGDGDVLISASNDRTIKLWNAENGDLIRELNDESKVQSIACSPDGSLLASGDEGNRVKLWKLSTGELWKTLPGHAGKIRAVAFSPDGKTLASGGEDRSARLWNVVTGQELLAIPTKHFVNGLAFHPNKQILAAALHDGTTQILSGE